MTKKEFNSIENFMLECMKDSAHDKEHVYRVLYTAISIAKTKDNVDYDVLITACLLHDIGRPEEAKNSKVNHATVGADKAYGFLIKEGYSESFSEIVKRCIITHRYRVDSGKPATLEAKILYDADKLDTCGVMGVARTLLWLGRTDRMLYEVSEEKEVIEKSKDITFFSEYNFKLKKLYGSFYTERANEIAEERRASIEDFYMSLLDEVNTVYKSRNDLTDVLTD